MIYIIYIYTFIRRFFSYNGGISWDWFEKKYRTGAPISDGFFRIKPIQWAWETVVAQAGVGSLTGWKWLPFPIHGCDRDFKTISPQVIIKQMTGSKGHWLNHQTWLKISPSEFPNFPKRSDLFLRRFSRLCQHWNLQWKWTGPGGPTGGPMKLVPILHLDGPWV